MLLRRCAPSRTTVSLNWPIATYGVRFRLPEHCRCAFTKSVRHRGASAEASALRVLQGSSVHSHLRFVACGALQAARNEPASWASILCRFAACTAGFVNYPPALARCALLLRVATSRCNFCLIALFFPYLGARASTNSTAIVCCVPSCTNAGDTCGLHHAGAAHLKLNFRRKKLDGRNDKQPVSKRGVLRLTGGILSFKGVEGVSNLLDWWSSTVWLPRGVVWRAKPYGSASTQLLQHAPRRLGRLAGAVTAALPN